MATKPPTRCPLTVGCSHAQIFTHFVGLQVFSVVGQILELMKLMRLSFKCQVFVLLGQVPVLLNGGRNLCSFGTIIHFLDSGIAYAITSIKHKIAHHNIYHSLSHEFPWIISVTIPNNPLGMSLILSRGFPLLKYNSWYPNMTSNCKYSSIPPHEKTHEKYHS